MFVKSTITGISGFLDLATIPVKNALGRRGTSGHQAKGSPRISLLQQTPEGVLLEKLVMSGPKEACRTKVTEMMIQGAKVVLEEFSMEEVADLCLKHNYRWRFHADSQASLKFVVEPGKPVQPDARA